MIYFKLSSFGQILDVSIIEKEGYVVVDTDNDQYPFKDFTIPMMCCYRIEVENERITMMTLAVPDKVFFAVKQTADDNIVASGDAETLVNCYELFGGNM